MASGVQNLMNKGIVKHDLVFFACFHENWLFNHFSWLQKGDHELGNTPGFVNRHLCVRYYLMKRELEDLSNKKWLLHDGFSPYVKLLRESNFNEVEIIDQEKKADMFLLQALTTLRNHFKLFTSKLLFLALFS